MYTKYNPVTPQELDRRGWLLNIMNVAPLTCAPPVSLEPHDRRGPDP